jgi:hypothetical protein
VPELEIRVEPVVKLQGDDGRSRLFGLSHLLQETPVPLISLQNSAVDFHGHPPEQVLHSRGEGMQKGGQSRQFDGVRLFRPALLQERPVDIQQLL